MSSRPLVFLGIFIIILALIAAGGYVMHTVSVGGSTPHATTTPSNTEYGTSPATTTAQTATSTRILYPPPSATSTLDTSSWTMHVENSLGYSIEYPSSFLSSFHEGVLTLVVPKGTYFHWPLLDDAKITVSATTTCPEIMAPDRQPSVTYPLNGRQFTRTVGTDIGAGNRYLEFSDTAKANGVCYSVSILDHGANGAGLYVDDLSLIHRYDAQHDTDLAALIKVYDSMVLTFRILAPAN